MIKQTNWHNQTDNSQVNNMKIDKGILTHRYRRGENVERLSVHLNVFGNLGKIDQCLEKCSSLNWLKKK